MSELTHLRWSSRPQAVQFRSFLTKDISHAPKSMPLQEIISCFKSSLAD